MVLASRGRRIRRVAVAVFVCLLVFFAAGFPVYVAPQIDLLRRADAIFVLGGNGYGRYTDALELGLQGLAPRVVMSNPAGAQDIWLADLCAHQRYSFTVSCFEPAPATTSGEARELRRLATAEGWHTVIVVTFRPHVSRARYILEQCFGGELIMDDGNDKPSLEDWSWAYFYQTGAYVRAAVEPAC